MFFKVFNERSLNCEGLVNARKFDLKRQLEKNFGYSMWEGIFVLCCAETDTNCSDLSVICLLFAYFCYEND